MLSVKQKTFNKNKLIIYVFIITLLVGALVLTYFTNIIDSFKRSDDIAIELDLPVTGQPATQNLPNIASSSEAVNIEDIDVELFNKIANDPKFNTLKENYKPEGKVHKKGKKNPFLP